MKELKVNYTVHGESLWLGTLADDGSDILFQYSPVAIARGLELSPIRLPLRPNAYPDKQADYLPLMRVPGLIYDSLPDSWGFQLMNRRMKAKGINTETVSVLDRLAYLGDNTMGALTYEPCSENNLEVTDLTLIELAKEVRALETNDSHEVLDELAKAGGSPGGARPKALVYYKPATGQMSTEYIPSAEAWLIKFPAKEDAKDSCALEELYARLARKCGLGMGDTQFFELPDGLTAFGTKRFDREHEQRIHVHSLAGLLHVNFQIPALGYSEFMRATRRLTRDARELKKALQRCIFNVLMNNRDDHAKNLSYLLNTNQEWELAPPYDLTYCPGYQGEHFMDVAGEGKSPTQAHILKVAQDGGLKEKDAQHMIDEVLDLITANDFKNTARDLPISRKTLAMVGKAIEANRSRLLA
ncbi:type II toxin-antitoxin system HipA family toxin [Undibacterium sp. CY18W]|uniref:Type II toxin-antitoxin system HipA family toxin n=1 Tax=Undibacterium hunanense TaxID=2762292 RepID=A0ABR6ZLE8_9BURK|nr:type II toxin-antitoxin system HipA family toxin [Undibacterium hunanense]MBC3916722.1 type II toxin-antitoxin system HipA family toxin [Undibacterium hunanense]